MPVTVDDARINGARRIEHAAQREREPHAMLRLQMVDERAVGRLTGRRAGRERAPPARRTMAGAMATLPFVTGGDECREQPAFGATVDELTRERVGIVRLGPAGGECGEFPDRPVTAGLPAEPGAEGARLSTW